MRVKSRDEKRGGKVLKVLWRGRGFSSVPSHVGDRYLSAWLKLRKRMGTGGSEDGRIWDEVQHLGAAAGRLAAALFRLDYD